MPLRLPRLLVSFLLALVSGAGVLSASVAHAAGPSSVTLQGRGFGHGHGMSQYGAQGAAKKGLTYRQIMRFYYPGTGWGTAGRTVSVHISGDTSDDVVVANRSGLTARSLKSSRTWRLSQSGAKRWRLTPTDHGADTLLSVLTGTWHRVRVLAGPAEFKAGGAPIKLFTPGGARSYRGVLRSAGGASRDTVNILSLESYLRGVVPAEMPASWEPAAVRAQAVAARTYAAYERADPMSSHYQICDTSLCQVYNGVAAEYPASDSAIRATKGQILTYAGKPAFTQFSASDGGWTTDGGQPYLPAKQDPYDGYPTWKATVKATAIERAFPGIGDFQRLAILKRDGRGTWNGRVVSIRIVGARGSTTLSGERFRSVFGLRSTWFRQV